MTALVDEAFRAYSAVAQGDGDGAKRIVTGLDPTQLRDLVVEAGILYALACQEYERRAAQ